MGRPFLRNTFSFLLVSSLLPFISSTSYAANYVEGSFGIAWLASDNSELDSNTYAPYRIHYGHQISHSRFLETGYLGGDNYEDESKDDLEMDMIYIKLKHFYKINDSYAIYAKVGAGAYRYDLENDDKSISKKNGLGLSLSVGYEFTLENDISVGFEYEHFNTARFRSNTVNGNVKYHFM
ncbi:hypothetical protein TW85_16775 [Marinomonas sp. S3726]|uniref:porin family protein n=1 Tax=Marinomonas sp. S3726 TaxID=579484 RepID=UPI0005FA484B|nr:porin family protein [Marinomonas sp. S3726]KJZ11483.1 hypothetical protein TW85_16775 [Marinomonas sp. S3726]